MFIFLILVEPRRCGTARARRGEKEKEKEREGEAEAEAEAEAERAEGTGEGKIERRATKRRDGCGFQATGMYEF